MLANIKLSWQCWLQSCSFKWNIKNRWNCCSFKKWDHKSREYGIVWSIQKFVSWLTCFAAFVAAPLHRKLPCDVSHPSWRRSWSNELSQTPPDLPLRRLQTTNQTRLWPYNNHLMKKNQIVWKKKTLWCFVAGKVAEDFAGCGSAVLQISGRSYWSLTEFVFSERLVKIPWTCGCRKVGKFCTKTSFTRHFLIEHKEKKHRN